MCPDFSNSPNNHDPEKKQLPEEVALALEQHIKTTLVDQYVDLYKRICTDLRFFLKANKALYLDIEKITGSHAAAKSIVVNCAEELRPALQLMRNLKANSVAGTADNLYSDLVEILMASKNFLRAANDSYDKLVEIYKTNDPGIVEVQIDRKGVSHSSTHNFESLQLNIDGFKAERQRIEQRIDSFFYNPTALENEKALPIAIANLSLPKLRTAEIESDLHPNFMLKPGELEYIIISLYNSCVMLQDYLRLPETLRLVITTFNENLVPIPHTSNSYEYTFWFNQSADSDSVSLYSHDWNIQSMGLKHLAIFLKIRGGNLSLFTESIEGPLCAFRIAVTLPAFGAADPDKLKEAFQQIKYNDFLDLN